MLHGKWLLSLKAKYTIARKLDAQILDNGEAVYQDSGKGKDLGLAVPGDLLQGFGAGGDQSPSEMPEVTQAGHMRGNHPQ